MGVPDHLWEDILINARLSPFEEIDEGARRSRIIQRGLYLGRPLEIQYRYSRTEAPVEDWEDQLAHIECVYFTAEVIE